MTNLKMGIGWYDPESWKVIKRMCVDSDQLDASYRKWLRGAEMAERRLRKEGYEVERIAIDPHMFAVWCAARGCKLDSSARAEYVTELLQAKHRNPGIA